MACLHAWNGNIDELDPLPAEEEWPEDPRLTDYSERAAARRGALSKKRLATFWGRPRMRVYTGAVAGKEIPKLHHFDIGRFVTPAPGGWKYPVNGVHWALDNGAFGAWRQGKEFDGDAFLGILEKIALMVEGEVISKDGENIYCRRPLLPDFGVIPDIVAGGPESLEFSLWWLDNLPTYFPWYLVVQDGMTEEDVQDALEWALELWGCIRGIFVGGTLEWKLKTSAAWVRFAHERGMVCHIGRVGTFRRLLWAESIGANSVDSTNFARSDSYALVEEARMQQRLPVARNAHLSKPKARVVAPVARQERLGEA